MNWVLMTGIVASALLFLVLWYVRSVKNELAQFKRETYYNASRMREASREIGDSVEALKIQLAGVASGVFVPKDLIQSGRLYREISATAAQDLLNSSNPSVPSDRSHHGRVLLDVGTPKQFQLKHIPGARSIPLEELETRFEHDLAREATIIVYCAEGDRSRLACEFLGRQGYMTVYHLVDGLQRWPGPMIERESLQLIQVQSKSQELCERGE